MNNNLYLNFTSFAGKTSEDFNEFLHCIYPKTERKIDSNNVYKVLPLADEYNVKSMLIKCKRYLNFHLTNEQASTEEIVLCHGLATRYQFQGIRDVCATRLTNAGLRDIPLTGTEDADDLLEIHKDVLKKQGELLDMTRTELVNLYINKDLAFVNVKTPFDVAETRGEIIKFKTSIGDDFKMESSTPVTLWDIDFKAVIKVSTTENTRFVSFVLCASDFKEKDHRTACVINAKLYLRNLGDELGQHLCVIREKEATRGSSSFGIKKREIDLISEGYIVDEEVEVIFFFLVKKPFLKDQ